MQFAVANEHSPRAYTLGYGAATVAVGLAFVVYPLLGLPGSQVNFTIYLAAVAFSAWYGGLGPGLFATLLSVILTSYFYLPPVASFELGDPVVRLRMLIFVLGALFVNGLSYTRLRAENRTAAEQARLHVTLSSIGDAVIVTDKQGKISFMNPAAEANTGWKASEAAGRDLTEVFRIIDEQTHRQIENPVSRVLRDGSVAGIADHALLVARDGTELPIDDTGSPVRSSSGDITGVVLVFRNVSDRRKADRERDYLLQQMQYERQRLNHILSNVPGVVWEAWGKPDDKQQHIDFVSDYVEKMLGYTVEEWINTPNFWLTITHPDDKAEAARIVAGQFESGEGGANRFRWITKDGRVIWVEANSTVIRDENGAPAGMRGVTMDITEQKRLEDAVKQQAEDIRTEYERLASLIANINIGLVLVDTNGRYTLANDKWLEQTGYTREQVIGKHHSEFSTNPRGNLTESMINKVQQTGEPIVLREFWIRNANKPQGWYADWSILPLRGADNKITGVLNALLDVTEKVLTRQQIEEQRSTLRTIVEGTPIGLALIDREMRIVDLNAEWARMTGIDMTTAKGRVLYSINPSFEQRRAYYDRVMAGEAIELQNVPYGPLGAREQMYRDIHLRPVVDPNGAITGMLNAVIDVTVRHLLDKQKDEFIAVASHELKTPITTIKGYTQLSLRAARKQHDESLVRALTVVNERADRLTRLINEMLDISRIQSGNLPLTIEEIDLAQLVREVVANTELTSPEFHFDLSASDESLRVHADRQRIEQVVINLVQNAIKYSSEKNSAEVGARCEDGQALVYVCDYGVGIPAAQQGEVFKRFFRASNVAYTNYGGLGLGLYISHGIVERHGGRMWVESEEGKGSTFYFTLPLAGEGDER